MGAAAVAAAGSQISLSSCSAPQANEKLATCEEKNIPLNLSFQEGIVGLEPWGGGLAERVNELQDALKGRNIKISAICAGFKGFQLSTDPKVFNEFMTTYKEILAAAGQLGAVGVIMVPAFNSQVPVRPHTLETRAWLVEQLKELGDYAAQNNTAVILEPLNRQEAFFLRQVGDAASICRDVNSKGVTCMGDFWHMTAEENSDYGAFFSAGDYLSHVHVASRRRRSMPGEDGEADNYIEGFKALKQMNYKGFVSFECGSQGNKADTIPAAVKLLREQWDQA